MTDTQAEGTPVNIRDLGHGRCESTINFGDRTETREFANETELKNYLNGLGLHLKVTGLVQSIPVSPIPNVRI